jgi:hypothetical protein
MLVTFQKIRAFKVPAGALGLASDAQNGERIHNLKYKTSLTKV